MILWKRLWTLYLRLSFLVSILCEVSFGLNICINSDNSMLVTSSKTQQSMYLTEDQSMVLKNLKIRHCYDYLKIKTLEHIDNLSINSEVPLFFWGADVKHLSISTPQLEFRKENRIETLNISSNLATLGARSILNTRGINFRGEKFKIKGQLYFAGETAGELSFLDSRMQLFVVFGRLFGQHLKIKGNYLILRNRGNIEVEDLQMTLTSPLSEIHQNGFWNNSRFVQSYGRMSLGNKSEPGYFVVEDWTLLNMISITIYLGKIEATNIRGAIDLLSLTDNRCYVCIEKLIGNINIVNNGGSFKLLHQISSQTDPSAKGMTILSNKSAYSYVGNSNAHLEGIVARNNALTEINDVPGVSFLRIDRSDVGISKIKGADHLYATGDSNITIDRSDLGSAHFGAGTRTEIRRSKVENGVNQGGMYLENTEMHRFSNNSSDFPQDEEAAVLFSQQNSANKVVNGGIIYSMNGELAIQDYFGRSRKASIELIETKDAPIIESEHANNMFQGRGTSICVDKIAGQTTVNAPRSTLRKGFIPGLQFVNSHVSVYLDYMPKIEEFPVHNGGSLNLRVNLSHDYINDSDKIYGDAIFFIDMHGYNWKNINADFVTKGLEVINAGIMGNYNGRLALEDFLAIKATEIINKADPTLSKKGEQPNVHFYLQQNSRDGIFAGGNVTFDAKGRIKNSYATIASRNGNICMRAKDKIQNNCGTISGINGYISGENIVNKDRSISHSRIHRGQSQSWYCDIYTAELCNRSDRAEMRFGDRLKLEGKVHNIGSSIRSGGVIDIKGCPFLEMQSVLNNCAEIGGSNIHIKTDKLYGIAVQLWAAGQLH